MAVVMHWSLKAARLCTDRSELFLAKFILYMQTNCCFQASYQNPDTAIRFIGLCFLCDMDILAIGDHFACFTTRKVAWYIILVISVCLPTCLSVCQTITFELLNVGSSYLHISLNTGPRSWPGCYKVKPWMCISGCLITMLENIRFSRKTF